ncbi:hypothetical protein [Haliangium sp.]|uniref:hypothetical protein n=1 Tax=Haliangium sp. TaxID=2663208 RepID=UPI003D0FAB5C
MSASALARPFAALVCALVLAGLLTACAGLPARTAPFRARPDTIDAGDLRGPFHGKVLEADTGQPVAGALVYATWTLRSGYGMTLPAGYHELVTNTDADGIYQIPRLEAPGGGVRVTDFYLVIYKRGYVAYRSDRRFSDLGPRHDFAQTDNHVTLERWRGELSHARHLRYVGGGPAIAALTGWEAEEAAAELGAPGSGMTAVASDLMPRAVQTRLVAARLLDLDQVKDITGFGGSFESGPLGDEPDTAIYSSQHLKAQGLPETYDVALRVWQLDPAEADRRYVELLESLPGIEETNELGDRSLRATEGQIYGVGFLDRDRGLVALITCGRNQCSSVEVAARLAAAVLARAEALWPDPAGGVGAGGDSSL